MSLHHNSPTSKNSRKGKHNNSTKRGLTSKLSARANSVLGKSKGNLGLDRTGPLALLATAWA